MIFTEFQGMKLSQLGFGAMRLPQLPNGSIDEEQTEKMIMAAMEQGVNYYDTAFPYHDGLSEVVVGRVLNRYPRENWYLADKFPGHQIAASYDPAAIFEKQLKKCGVEYFDFYLLHNVYENSMGVYLDPKWGILDYFREQKRLGRIRHLGFSSHGGVENLKSFLDAAGDDMEFCQIQLNWLDWTLQDARSKVALLNERSIPVWVMEPLRGGRLCSLNEGDIQKLKVLRPDETVPAWSFRFLQGIPGVHVILSGMSSWKQMEQNLATFREQRPLNDEEQRTLLDIAEGMKDSIPCTSCRYCVRSCPMKLDIPRLLAIGNEMRFSAGMNTTMQIEALPENKRPSACIACGRCIRMCPQHIDIPTCLRQMSETQKCLPSWA